MPRPEYVLGRIDIGVVGVSAGDAPEGGLIRPVLRRHMAAVGAGPARVPGIDPDQASSPSRQLVFEEREERAPSLGENGAVESGLLPDVSSGGLPGPSGASGHVPDRQILDIDDGLDFAGRHRGLVEKIPTHVGHFFKGSRHAELLFDEVPAFRSLPVFSGELPLFPSETDFRPFHGPKETRVRMDPGAVRERGEGDDPEIQSDFRRGSWGWFLDVPFRLDRHGPPSGLAGHGGVPDLSRNLPGEADLDPPHLGEKDPGQEISFLRIPGCKIELHLERIGIPEGISLALPFEPWEALRVSPVQGFPNGPVEVLEGLLLGVDRAAREKPVFLARSPQGQDLGQVPVGQERHPGFKPSRLKIEGLVPDEPDAPRMAGQESLLFDRRNKTEFEGLNSFHVGHCRRKPPNESQCMDGPAVRAILPRAFRARFAARLDQVSGAGEG